MGEDRTVRESDAFGEHVAVVGMTIEGAVLTLALGCGHTAPLVLEGGAADVAGRITHVKHCPHCARIAACVGIHSEARTGLVTLIIGQRR